MIIEEWVTSRPSALIVAGRVLPAAENNATGDGLSLRSGVVYPVSQ